MNIRKGQNYLTDFADLVKRRVLFATLGRDHWCFADFAAALELHNGHPHAVTHVAMDMSDTRSEINSRKPPPCLASASSLLPSSHQHRTPMVLDCFVLWTTISFLNARHSFSKWPLWIPWNSVVSRTSTARAPPAPPPGLSSNFRSGRMALTRARVSPRRMPRRCRRRSTTASASSPWPRPSLT